MIVIFPITDLSQWIKGVYDLPMPITPANDTFTLGSYRNPVRIVYEDHTE